MKDSQKLIIVPDVHGRGFWREAVKEHPEALFVFLGDYLDPYPHEGIAMDEAIAGLKDIIKFKKESQDKVVLLWGNHDLHYIYPEMIGTRYDLDKGLEIADLLHRNQELFQLCTECEAGGKRFLFTHAGICRSWLRKYYPEINPESITAGTINSLLLREDFEKTFSAVSFYRGGWELAGSPIWADVEEHIAEYNRIPGVVQVFGHSMMKEALNIDDELFCLDCQQCFTLDLETGEMNSLTKK